MDKRTGMGSYHVIYLPLLLPCKRSYNIFYCFALLTSNIQHMVTFLHPIFLFSISPPWPDWRETSIHNMDSISFMSSERKPSKKSVTRTLSLVVDRETETGPWIWILVYSLGTSFMDSFFDNVLLKQGGLPHVLPLAVHWTDRGVILKSLLLFEFFSYSSKCVCKKCKFKK